MVPEVRELYDICYKDRPLCISTLSQKLGERRNGSGKKVCLKAIGKYMVRSNWETGMYDHGDTSQATAPHAAAPLAAASIVAQTGHWTVCSW